MQGRLPLCKEFCIAPFCIVSSEAAPEALPQSCSQHPACFSSIFCQQLERNELILTRFMYQTGDQVISTSSPGMHTSFPFSTQIISVMNIQQQCLCFPQTHHAENRPLISANSCSFSSYKMGEKEEKTKKGQAMHPPKKTSQAAPL
jgi:hypothetical protein